MIYWVVCLFFFKIEDIIDIFCSFFLAITHNLPKTAQSIIFLRSIPSVLAFIFDICFTGPRNGKNLLIKDKNCAVSYLICKKSKIFKTELFLRYRYIDIRNVQYIM